MSGHWHATIFDREMNRWVGIRPALSITITLFAQAFAALKLLPPLTTLTLANHCEQDIAVSNIPTI